MESESGSADSAPLAGSELLARRVSSIEGLIATREYREARRRIGELLIEDPDNATVHELILQVNQDEQALVQALAEAHEAAEPLRAAGDLAEVEAVWRNLDERFPNSADIKAELAVAGRELELERRRESRADAERQAAPLLEAEDLAAALEVWDRHLEAHPDDGEPIQLLDGRYGPYVRHGKLNASLPKDTAAEDVTLGQALDLLAARASRGGNKGSGRRKR